MGSKVVLRDQQPRGEEVKQKNAGGEGRTRRVLRDIQNLGNAQQNQITRPITRGYIKKQVGQKKETAIAPSERSVIVISSDREEMSEKKKNKKIGKSLTSVLSARSKAACGIATKKQQQKDQIVEIDAADVGNELAAVEYVEDIYKFYKSTEDEGRVSDYMGAQPEINSKMRAILVDWLIEVHKKFELQPETLYLTINLIDRFLSLKTVPRRELQLVGISSMLIACKYEEIWSPDVSDFIIISDNAYVRAQILAMEKSVLGRLEWYLTVPTPYVFLVRYVKAATMAMAIEAAEEMENMSFFMAELGVMDYTAAIDYAPSVLAAAAVYAARRTLSGGAWNDTLRHYTGYSEDEIIGCAKLLVGLHSGAPESKLKAVYRKFSSPDRGAVALFPPAVALLAAPAAAGLV